ncbi:MAG: very short patch repair endonuclease [Clostridiaceae bacterium]|nr:very short patch repair endonuclease [Clostridiaceae bacterium]
MADVFSKEKRSEIMSHVRSNGNRATEEKLVSLLRENGIKGWRRNYRLFGNPDFVFPKKKIAVFVDGEFWHGHPTRGQIPKTNREFWLKKIEQNKIRDNLVNQTLKDKGWIVVRIWQHELKDNRWFQKIKIALDLEGDRGELNMSNKIDEINLFIQDELAKLKLNKVGAVQAARWLDSTGLLKDSKNRPGLPLRRLLRDGKICEGKKEGRFWFIYSIHPCMNPEGKMSNSE